MRAEARRPIREPLEALDDRNPYARGLVGWWRMTEGKGDRVTDWAGNNHGTLINGPTWAAGERGTALDFDGTDDRVDVAADSLAASPGLADFTVVWRMRDDTPGDRHVICDSRGAGHPYSGWSLVGNNSGRVMLDLNDATTRNNFTLSSSFPWTGGWDDCALRVVRNGNATLWVNGVQAGQVDVSSAVNADVQAGNPLKIGGHHLNDSSSVFEGAMEYVMVYLRVLGYTDEIRALQAAPDLPIWRERSGVSMAGLAVPNELTITDRIGVGDSVDIVRPVAVIDSLAVADEIANLKHLMTLADAVQIDEMTRAGSPCHGGYFERPSGTCQSGYQEDDDQDSNLYQEMV